VLRWTIAILFLANVLAFVATLGVFGTFGPSLIASGRGPDHLNRQVNPDWLTARPVTASEAADQPVVGGPMPSAPIAASALAQ
jgi:hypothetical protein